MLTPAAYRFNNWYLFLAYLFISLVILYGYSHYIIKDEMYYNSIGDRLSTERIRELLDAQKKLEWVGYVFAPLKLLVKISFTAFCLYIGVILLDYDVTFANVFKVSLLAEIVFIASAAITFIIHLLFTKGHSFEELARFDFFSLRALLSGVRMPPYLNYPLQVINLYEIAYWFMLAAGLRAFVKKPGGAAGMLPFVLSTYGIGLLSWTVLIVFMTISFSS